MLDEVAGVCDTTPCRQRTRRWPAPHYEVGTTNSRYSCDSFWLVHLIRWRRDEVTARTAITVVSAGIKMRCSMGLIRALSALRRCGGPASVDARNVGMMRSPVIPAILPAFGSEQR